MADVIEKAKREHPELIEYDTAIEELAKNMALFALAKITHEKAEKWSEEIERRKDKGEAVPTDEIIQMRELWNTSFDDQDKSQKAMDQSLETMQREIKDEKKRSGIESLSKKLLEVAEKYNPPKNPELN